MAAQNYYVDNYERAVCHCVTGCGTMACPKAWTPTNLTNGCLEATPTTASCVCRIHCYQEGDCGIGELPNVNCFVYIKDDLISKY